MDWTAGQQELRHITNFLPSVNVPLSGRPLISGQRCTNNKYWRSLHLISSPSLLSVCLPIYLSTYLSSLPTHLSTWTFLRIKNEKIRWVWSGCILTCLFELKNKIRFFLTETSLIRLLSLTVKDWHFQLCLWQTFPQIKWVKSAASARPWWFSGWV